MVTGLHLYRVNFPDFDLSFPPFPSLLLDNRFLDITALPSVTAQLPFPVSPLPFFAITCGPEQALLKFREVGVVGNLKDTTAAGQKFTPGNESSWGRKEGGKNFVAEGGSMRAVPILSSPTLDTAIVSLMYELRTKERRFVRRINTGINVMECIPDCPYLQEISLSTNSFLIGGISRIIAGDKQTTLSETEERRETIG